MTLGRGAGGHGICATALRVVVAFSCGGLSFAGMSGRPFTARLESQWKELPSLLIDLQPYHVPATGHDGDATTHIIRGGPSSCIPGGADVMTITLGASPRPVVPTDGTRIARREGRVGGRRAVWSSWSSVEAASWRLTLEVIVEDFFPRAAGAEGASRPSPKVHILVSGGTEAGLRELLRAIATMRPET